MRWLLLCTAMLVASSVESRGKTRNTIDRERNIYIALIYPRVFDAVVSTRLETPIQIRAIFYHNLALYNAWVNYHPTAVDIFGRAPNRRPAAERTVENKNKAIFYAIFRVYAGSPGTFGGPDGIPEYLKLFTELGLDPDDARTTGDDAVAVGNRAGFETLRLVLNDGWNPDGLETSSVRNYQFPFQDTTGYHPVNAPGPTPRFPLRWAPRMLTNRIGAFAHQVHVVPQAGSALTYGISRAFVQKRKVKSPYRYRNAPNGKLLESDLRALRKGAEKVLSVSRQLTERQRLLAELFDNKVVSFRSKANPPGVPSIAASLRYLILSPLLDWSFDEEIIYGIAAQLLSYDTTVLVWKEKLRLDTVRPTGDIMHFLFGDERRTVWGGPGLPPQPIRAGAWQSYIGTMAHSEFPSASACLCSALAEQALLYTGGNDNIPYNLTIPKGSSAAYPGQVPTSDVTLEIKTLSEWGSLCSESRLYAGVHFPDAIPAGQQLCKNISRYTKKMVDQMIAGTYKPSWKNDLPRKIADVL